MMRCEENYIIFNDWGPKFCSVYAMIRFKKFNTLYIFL